MRVLRSVAAIAAGLGFMSATVTMGALVSSALTGGEPAANQPSVESAAHLYINLVVCGIGAILGGWLSARIAAFAPYGHAAVMAAIVGAVAIRTVTGVPAAGYPDWYPTALGLIAVSGVLLGGKLRAAAASAAGPVVA